MRRNYRVIVVLLAALIVCGISTSAHATVDLDNMEYYTYNGFDAVTLAFQKIALIFSDGRYKGLFAVAALFGILFGGAAVYYRLATGARTPIFGWAWPMGLGIMVYFAMVLPTSNVMVYDPVQNRTQVIGGIPKGIAVPAGILNGIEREVVDIISTSGDPTSYVNSAGGFGFNLIMRATLAGVSLPDTYLAQSLSEYLEKCLLYDMMLNPNGTADPDGFIRQTADFLPILQSARNKAVYAVWYDDTHRNGTAMTCTQMWNNYLGPALNSSSTYTLMLQAVCSAAGLDPFNASELLQCKNAISNFSQVTSGHLVSAEKFLQQVVIAKMMNDIVLEHSPDGAIKAFANRNLMSSGLGIGVVSYEWLPVLRAVITAIVLSLIPFLFIFIATPLAGRVVSLSLGFLIWLTAWGVSDAITHSIATDYAIKCFEHVKQNNLAYAAIMMYPDATMKALSIFGYARSSGIMLATILTMMLVKFGGHAMAMLAGQFSSLMKTQGAGAATKTQSPEGVASTLKSAEVTPATMANAHKYDFWGRSEARTFEMATATEGSMQTMGALGGGAFGAAGQMGFKASVTNERGVGFAEGYKAAADANGGVRHYGGLEGDRAALGTESYEKLRDTAGRSNLVFKEVNKGLNELAKFKQIFWFAKKAGYAKDENDFKGMYEGLLRHHAQISWTLDEKSAAWLSKETGMDFKKGDRVTMARDEDGNITLAKGEGGNLRNTFNLSRHVEGRHDTMAVGDERWKQLRNELLANGHTESVGMMDRMKASMEKYGINEGALVEIWRKRDGGLAYMTVKHGSQVLHMDDAGQIWRTTIDKQDRESTGYVKDHKELVTSTTGRESTILGWSGKFDDVEFTVAERKEIGNGQVLIKGLTTDGSYATVLGKETDGEQVTISRSFQAGSRFDGAALAQVMNGDGKLPVDFSNEADKYRFAKAYYDEISAAVKDQTINMKTGRAGIGGSIPIIGAGITFGQDDRSTYSQQIYKIKKILDTYGSGAEQKLADIYFDTMRRLNERAIPGSGIKSEYKGDDSNVVHIRTSDGKTRSIIEGD